MYVLEEIVILTFLSFLSYYDIKHRKIKDKALVVFFVVVVLFKLLDLKKFNVLDSILGFVLGGSILLILALFTEGGVGGGDIKLIAVLGFYDGLNGVLTLCILSLLSVSIGLYLMSFVRKKKAVLPFAPFILGAFILNQLIVTNL